MKLRYGLVVFFLVLMVIGAFAEEQRRYDYRVLRVIDGDTVQIDAVYLPKELKGTLYLRIHSIDTPEKGSKAKCIREAMDAMKAKFFLEQEIKNAKKVEVTIRQWDKYGGRVLGDIYIDDVPASKKMMEKGLAKAYNGGKKTGWC